jgi:L-lactate utilization protein LutB
MELFSLNFFEIYGIGCTACLKTCPHFSQKAPQIIEFLD